jgi:hypothetical protein
MAVSELQHSDDDGERTHNPFFVDDPEPLSDLGSPAPVLVPQ